MHIAQIGTGRVGRPTAYTILCSELADKITVCDIKPGLATAFAEELKHVTASLKLDVKITACEADEEVSDADVVVVSVGKPRTPGVTMTRRDLAVQNGSIIKHVAKSLTANNPNAKHVIITNPVDAMAMVYKKYSNAKFVISTGTNLETLRFKSGLATSFNIPVTSVEGYVGGEHGTNATILWSTVKINRLPLDEYMQKTKKRLIKDEIDSYVKSVSKLIVDNIGGTEFGPAAAFRDIIRAIVMDTNEILPIASSTTVDGLPEPVFVSVPLQLGRSIGYSLYDKLSTQEKIGLKDAAKAIYQTYKTTISALEKQHQNC
ncbi:MAG: NAD(P)-binding domain-containing protein [Candidatus Bathyarchaeota archaeon]|nr:MAG: NAD(P)-binding domain-containing protein [Candidatus Bathyarchaeota archaeon]